MSYRAQPQSSPTINRLASNAIQWSAQKGATTVEYLPILSFLILLSFTQLLVIGNGAAIKFCNATIPFFDNSQVSVQTVAGSIQTTRNGLCPQPAIGGFNQSGLF
ncbi:MAG: hypothetical protein K1X79_01300 [Oligoflexia bacterium]|nr:hypothetical protein [Oligoflexia bacterium]